MWLPLAAAERWVAIAGPPALVPGPQGPSRALWDVGSRRISRSARELQVHTQNPRPAALLVRTMAGPFPA
jgi:hypothetical protein